MSDWFLNIDSNSSYATDKISTAIDYSYIQCSAVSPANALGAMKVIRLAAKSLVSGSRKWNHSVSSAENTIQVIKCSERDKCIRRHHGDRVQFQVPEDHN